MNSLRIEMRFFFCTILSLAVLPLGAGADTVSAAVGRPLQRAEAALAARNYPAAFADLQKASAVPGPTPYERSAIAQLHGAAEAGTGNYARAAVDYQAVLASDAQPAARLDFTQAIAGLYFQAGDYPQAVVWVNRYVAAGGADARTRALLPQAYFQESDYAAAEQAVLRDEQDERGGVSPAELRLLAYSAQKAGDQARYFSALLALLRAAPDAATWNAAISLVVTRPDFPDSLMLDAYRLRRATGTLTAPGDFEDYTERAILAGQPKEARAVIDQGFTQGVLDPATDGGHALRLKTLADGAPPAAAAPAADPLQDGVIAYQAGQNATAAAAFQQASGTAYNAASELARLWAVRAESGARTP